MTHDPATLAAVRERIEGLRRDSPNDNWDVGFNTALNAVRSMIADEIAGSFRKPDALTPAQAAEVRRIAREEAVNALATMRVPTRGMIAGTNAKAIITDDPPPAPPSPARVEGILMNRRDGTVVLCDEHCDYHSPLHPEHVYVREQHGVTDAASAEAFERAVREAHNMLRETMRPLDRAWHYSIGKAISALAPFLPDAPR